LSRIKKGILLVCVDLVFILASIWAAFSLRLEVFYIPPAHLLWIFVLAPLVAIPIFIKFGLYHAIIRYIGFQAFWAVAKVSPSTA
jgi:FlaA1/EpsC-like NDP-sugar epimerase